MADEKNSVLKENLRKLSEIENLQKYILGYKSSGQPRAVYDVVRDCTGIKKKKKKKKKSDVPLNQISFYTGIKGKKKKKKKKAKKHWHIDGY